MVGARMAAGLVGRSEGRQIGRISLCAYRESDIAVVRN